MPDIVYGYDDAVPTWSVKFEWPTVARLIEALPKGRALDLGCGNGWTTHALAESGFDAIGIDPSPTGIELARSAFADCRFEVASSDDDLAQRYGRFSLVLSLDVIPVVRDVWAFARRIHDVLEPGGTAIISTPYHGYAKNLVIALAGKTDRHYDPLWHSSLIRFFSVKTMGHLLSETGFTNTQFLRVGRIPMFAKAMVAVGVRPPQSN